MHVRYFPAAAAVVVALCLSATGLGVASPVGAQSSDSTAAVSVTPPSGSAPAVGVKSPTTTGASPVATTSTLPRDRFVVIEGRGFGHGRGLGQWGAYGYAKDKRWTYRQILDHFYGGTTAGAVSPDSAIGVRLSALDGKSLVVYQPKGRVYTAIEGQPGFSLPPNLAGAQTAVAGLGVQAAVTVPGDGGVTPTPTLPPLLTGSAASVRIELVRGGFQISDGATCDGPWAPRPLVATKSVTVSAGPSDPTVGADEPSEMLHVCAVKNVRTVYRGDLLTIDAEPGQKTVNLVGLEAYLRGVVPREIAAGWGDVAAEAVKAQAVAARSYASAEKRSKISNTCDTTACQVYGGRGRFVGPVFTSLEDPRTDRAVAETANEIRVDPRSGAPIRTEFSASTGGFTAPGAFPAVVDEGDATPANPNRSWTVRLNGSRFDTGRKLGGLLSVAIAARDGYGDDGGRVAKVVLTFANGTKSLTGAQVMSEFSLRSSWFNIRLESASPGEGELTAQTAADAAADSAMTGDAGAVIAVGALPTTTIGGAPATAATVAPKRTATTRKRSKTLPTVAVVVAAGADPIKTVVGGAVVGTPTTTRVGSKTAKR